MNYSEIKEKIECCIDCLDPNTVTTGSCKNNNDHLINISECVDDINEIAHEIDLRVIALEEKVNTLEGYHEI